MKTWMLVIVPLALLALSLNGCGANNTSGMLSVLYNNGNGTFAPKITSAVGPWFLTGIAAEDLDGDGDLDVVTVGAANGVGRVTVHRNQGSRSFLLTTYVMVIPNNVAIGVGDLNSDGRLDVAAAGENGVKVLLGVCLP
ncbi:MAG: VCBS repeat-containing protein [Minicystis sp.]